MIVKSEEEVFDFWLTEVFPLLWMRRGRVDRARAVSIGQYMEVTVLSDMAKGNLGTFCMRWYTSDKEDRGFPGKQLEAGG